MFNRAGLIPLAGIVLLASCDPIEIVAKLTTPEPAQTPSRVITFYDHTRTGKDVRKRVERFAASHTYRIFFNPTGEYGAMFQIVAGDIQIIGNPMGGNWNIWFHRSQAGRQATDQELDAMVASFSTAISEKGGPEVRSGVPQ